VTGLKVLIEQEIERGQHVANHQKVGGRQIKDGDDSHGYVCEASRRSFVVDFVDFVVVEA
jgi:hypothetical protein